jgi:hypothetical protein
VAEKEIIHINKLKTNMLGNFSYYNPTKLYFGDESLNFLKDELKNYGPMVLNRATKKDLEDWVK